MRNGAAVEADGEELSLVIGVKDGVGAAFVVDTEGAEASLRHGQFSLPVSNVHISIAKLVHGTSHLLRTGVIRLRREVEKCRGAR